ncbi:MAG: gliding motility-associated C-terminal domain-containing protein [Saprospiraceae bacterium]|nr:gliding motility-associated C-terminal domain-containing protein [Saprospiraceae bacterium]
MKYKINQKAFLYLLVLLSIQTNAFNQSLSNVVWSTYHGGSGMDAFRDMVIDELGFVYVVGTTSSTSNISTPSAYKTTNSGQNDVYLAKYTTSGQKVWSTYYGGSGDDIGQSIDLDPQGNVVITGLTFSASEISSPGTHKANISASGDIFVAKFTNSGILIWGTYYGGDRFDFANDIAADNNGNVIITGWTESGNGIASTGAYKSIKSDTTDICIAKFSPSGQIIWSTYYGHNGAELGLQVESDAQNNIYFSGWTSSTAQFATVGTHQSIYGGESADAFIGKFNPNGTLLWVTYFGGSGRDYADALFVTPAGDVYAGGYTTSDNNISTPGVHQTTRGGDADVFLTRFNTFGTRMFSTYMGGNGFDAAFRIGQNADGNIVVTGHTLSTTNISTVNVFQPNNNGSSDAFVSVFTPAGLRIQSTYFGGSGIEESKAIVTDRSNAIYIAGKTTSSSNISSGNPSQSNYGGGPEDGFITKFLCTPPVINTNNRNICEGATLQLSTTSGSNYVWEGPGGFTSSIQNPQTTNLNQSHAGIYTVTVTDVSGCRATDSIQINVLNAPIVLPGSNSPLCLGGTLTLSSSGGVSYQWSGPSGFSSSLQNPVINNVLSTNTGIYKVTVTGSNGCLKTDSVNVNVSGQLNAAITSNSPVCDGDTIRLSVTGGSTVIWSGPAGYTSNQRSIKIPAAAQVAGTYTLTVTDNSGCSLRRDTMISVIPRPSARITGRDTICQNENTTLTAVGTGSYLWSTGGTTGQITVNPTQNTVYSLRLTHNGCSDSARYNIIVNKTPQINILTSVTNISPDQMLNLTATGADRYFWSPAAILSCTDCPNPVAKLQNTTEICVAGFNGFGCRAEKCITVEVNDPCDVTLPNIFSPNGDSRNDHWCSLAKDCIKEQHLTIYDRWGNNIYSSTGTEVCWNPENESVKLQNQVFTYILILNLIDGMVKTLTGSITLIK